MIASIKGLKHAPSNFSIEILPQYLNTNRQLVCYPGSVFEGLVKLTLSEPMSFQRLKIIFKATERVNYDAMGWEKIKNDDGRLFAVRTTLLGQPVSSNIENNQTTLEAGEHVYPFAVELPLVNYPPSIDHHLIATTFVLLGSLERDTGANGHSFRSLPYSVYFRPALQTRVNKTLLSHPSDYSEHTASLTHRISAHLSLPSLEYNLFDTTHIPIQFTLYAANEQYFADISLQQLHIALKQTITIYHKSFSRTETTMIHHVDSRMTNTSSSSSSMVFDCLLKIDQQLLPSVNYSTRFKVDYCLIVSVKTRHGPLSTKKKLFNLPIHFGTLPPGTLPHETIQLYTEEEVIQSTNLSFKPKFLRPLNNPVEFLPAYDELYRPPSYHSHLVTNSM
ncbi:uncharacterized protein BX664DRAFT_291240 [Halteromyces radiatus]|uniref:uncharacterized protein n=1 Tax=Halteromyces radiatus TaxID=101107 RepID=UPI0022207CCC|nr:uncharacterized protein BX664DRAFT_291240 [Halteromyces radiatus]KAI8096386.1 hypothetical protein BX664DRAFT_291240 [Halteromyces radiatus]